MWKTLPPPISFKCVAKKKYWRRKTKTLPWPDADPYLTYTEKITKLKILKLGKRCICMSYHIRLQ